MEYSFGPGEEQLRQQMPYDMSEEKWKGIQNRLRERVLQELKSPKETVVRRKTFIRRLRVPAAAAAGLALLLSLGLWNHWHNGAARERTAEQQLDMALSNMNDNELNWVHLLNETEVNEQYEYQ